MGRARERVDRRGDDHGEEERAGQPDRACAPERREAVPEPRDACGHRDREDGHVRQLDSGARGAEPDVHLRLVADVEEDDRDRDREHERPEPLGRPHERGSAREDAWARDGTRRHDAPRYRPRAPETLPSGSGSSPQARSHSGGR